MKIIFLDSIIRLESMKKQKVTLLLLMLCITTIVYAQKNSDDPSSNEYCTKSLIGTFSFSDITPDVQYNLAKELGIISKGANIKAPLYHLGMKKDQWYKKGMNSGRIAEITVEYPGNYNAGGLLAMLNNDYDEKYSENNDQVIMCRADFGNHVYLYSINSAKLTLKDLSEFQSYAEYFQWQPKPSIQDLRHMQDLLVYTYSEIGIGGATFIFPLKRINQNPLSI